MSFDKQNKNHPHKTALDFKIATRFDLSIQITKEKTTMAEFAGEQVATKVIGEIDSRIRRMIADAAEGRYDENDIKESVLAELQLINDGRSSKDFITA
mmetsp:Transcript_19585/g.24212  ORF Transcript_19585/g.24212 Transcript_19585/m.24212 type:complete len:98 (+) Transcript_19585:286-579(+)